MIVFLHLIQISFEPSPNPAKIFKKFVGSTFSILFWALTARCSGMPADQTPPSQARCTWVPHVERSINIRDSRLDTAYLHIFSIIYTELHLSGCFHSLLLSITAQKWVGYPKFPGRSYVLRSSCYVTVKQKNCTSRYCAAAAAAATSIYAATLRAEDVPQIFVNCGQKVGRNSRFEQHAEVFTGELENWHVNTLSKTESMGIGHNYRSKQFLSSREENENTRSHT